jgi:hypothetical protein
MLIVFFALCSSVLAPFYPLFFSIILLSGVHLAFTGWQD